MARQQWVDPAKASRDTETGELGHTLTWKRLPREAGHALVLGDHEAGEGRDELGVERPSLADH